MMETILKSCRVYRESSSSEVYDVAVLKTQKIQRREDGRPPNVFKNAHDHEMPIITTLYIFYVLTEFRRDHVRVLFIHCQLSQIPLL